MSQIDKAFLSAYSKKRSVSPQPTETRPLVDPTGQRLLRIHLSNSVIESLQPHVAATIQQPEAEPDRSVRNLPPSGTIHISKSGVRASSSSSVRRDPQPESAPSIPAPRSRTAIPPVEAPAQPNATHPIAKQRAAAPPTATPPTATPPTATPPTATLPDAVAHRKTLTSYLQQARQSMMPPTAPAPLSPVTTRWSNAPAATTRQRPATPPASPPESSSTHGPEQRRFDPPHSPSPAVTRPESTIPWFFGGVERSIKATADSKSVSARTANEARVTEGTARTKEPVRTNEPEARVAAAEYEDKKASEAFHARPMKSPAPTPNPPAAESQRRPAPLGKTLDTDRFAKITLPIQPVWEVDEFLWPAAVVNLLSTQAEAFYEVGLHLQHAQSKGLRVLSVTSGERGVGRSTTAMCLAKTLSMMGMKIGLIDGDYECPSLVDQLNLEAQHGWQQCFAENIPLDEAAIHAVEESMTLFPLTDSIASSHVAAHATRINKLIKRISNTCDMVIIDANRVTQKQSQLLGTGDEAAVDAALLIVDAELSLRQRVDAAVELVRQQGIQSVGLVENFHS